MNMVYQLLVYADGVNLLCKNIHSIQKNTEPLLFASKEDGLEANAEKTKYGICSCLINKIKDKIII